MSIWNFSSIEYFMQHLSAASLRNSPQLNCQSCSTKCIITAIADYYRSVQCYHYSGEPSLSNAGTSCSVPSHGHIVFFQRFSCAVAWLFTKKVAHSTYVVTFGGFVLLWFSLIDRRRWLLRCLEDWPLEKPALCMGSLRNGPAKLPSNPTCIRENCNHWIRPTCQVTN